MSIDTEFEIKNLFELDYFSNLDYFFARSMGNAFNENNPSILATCALVSKVLSKGHICIDIKKISKSEKIFVSNNAEYKIKFPGFDSWVKILKKAPMISNSIETPLVLDSNFRLYFAKYYDFQNRLIENLSQRVTLNKLNISKALSKKDSTCESEQKLDKESIKDSFKESIIDKMLLKYLSGSGQHIIKQKNAVKNALFKNFTIISGGPGTGKTYIVAIIKKILLSYAAEHNHPQPKIICMAPTGKAASRMDSGSTIHSVLKPQRDSSGFFYNKNNQLKSDAVIIDEASMIDISLLSRLLEAIPVKTKVIILGDKFQLSSIQAGSVFNDICNVQNLASNIFLLKYNFRSKGKTGIENLSKAINNNDVKKLEHILTSKEYPDVEFEPLTDQGMPANFLNKQIFKGYKAFFDASTINAALDEMDNFKILCAHNSGEHGTLQINHLCEKILHSANNFDIDKKLIKKIIMINVNDYKKDLFNGDTGICIKNREERKVYFKTVDTNIKQYRASDLPDHGTAFAITIHKSQGSEFETILIILPDRLSPVVTRQLLYTGVTRAKAKVIIAGDLNIIKKAIGLSVRHDSGLTEYLDKELDKKLDKKLVSTL